RAALTYWPIKKAGSLPLEPAFRSDCAQDVLFDALVLLRRAHPYADARALGDPYLVRGTAQHRIAHGDVGGEAVVGRTALTVVVEAVHRNRSGRAQSIDAGHQDVEHLAFELPVRVGEHRLVFRR